MSSNFFAMVNRMKLIDRWALMNNSTKENIAEHSHSVAVIAHALALIGNKKFGKSYNAERAALLALYHDTTEVITGDMPTPVKYYNDDIKNVYKDIERIAISALIKCIEEYRMGNREFEKALEAQQKKIEEINLDEVKYFREHFLDSYYLTLDEHTK